MDEPSDSESLTPQPSKQRKLDLQHQRRAQMSQEEKESQNEARRQRRTQESPEVTAESNQRRRQRREEESPEAPHLKFALSTIYIQMDKFFSLIKILAICHTIVGGSTVGVFFIMVWNENEVIFEKCDELKTVQQWDLEEFFEDRSAVDKTFVINYASMPKQQEIKHVCKKSGRFQKITIAKECHVQIVQM
ncbi:unnamed protein product [Orchesella dallaii]|uniref:Uncharacterized protein n=1 Tax=Orchesella dallaii TaxID=48710 RepID=A0ABP1QQS5_9HEXA